MIPEFALALFSIAVIGIPIFILLKNDYRKKRGCATCGNREICHGKNYTDRKAS